MDVGHVTHVAFSLVTFSSHFLAWRDWLTLTSFSVNLAAVC